MTDREWRQLGAAVIIVGTILVLVEIVWLFFRAVGGG
jgi:hypothetical protein